MGQFREFVRKQPKILTLNLPTIDEIPPPPESPVDPNFPRRVDYTRLYSSNPRRAGHMVTSGRTVIANQLSVARTREPVKADPGVSCKGTNHSPQKQVGKLPRSGGRGWDEQSTSALEKLLKQEPQVRSQIADKGDLPPFLQKIEEFVDQGVPHISQAINAAPSPSENMRVYRARTRDIRGL